MFLAILKKLLWCINRINYSCTLIGSIINLVNTNTFTFKMSKVIWFCLTNLILILLKSRSCVIVIAVSTQLKVTVLLGLKYILTAMLLTIECPLLVVFNGRCTYSIRSIWYITTFHSVGILLLCLNLITMEAVLLNHCGCAL